MSLSISSFRTEIKVIGMVLLALAVFELGTRLFERRLSVDLHAPNTAKKLSEGAGRRVLVFGNSLVRDGVDANILEEGIKARGAGPIRVERAYLIGTTASEWRYAFKHYFVDTNRAPDVLVLCFSNAHLQDHPLQRPLVARYYSDARDIPQIFAEDVTDFDGRTEFMLYGWSASFANRTALQRRLFDRLVPHYRENLLRVNETLKNNAGNIDGNHLPTYRHLEQLLKMAKEHNVRVFLTAMPAREYYSIDSQVEVIIKKTGVTLLDYRQAGVIGEGNFNDNEHMNKSGMVIYSQLLASELSRQFKQMEEAGRLTIQSSTEDKMLDR